MTIQDKTNSDCFYFKTVKEFERFLSKKHASLKGIWIRFFKKDSGEKTITHNDALDVALCYGWIDGQGKKYDDKSWIQRFTPRRPRSIWSKRNREHVGRLIKEGKMKPAGLKEVEKAKIDGRWRRAYDSPSKMIIPKDFLKALSKNKKAKSFFETLNSTNKYSIAWRLQTAKRPETTKKRMKIILKMMAQGKKFYE